MTGNEEWYLKMYGGTLCRLQMLVLRYESNPYQKMSRFTGVSSAPHL